MTHIGAKLCDGILSNGTEVRVYESGVCVAQFSRHERSYAYPGWDRCIKHRQPEHIREDWDTFVEDVEFRTNIHIGREHRPTYVTNRPQPQPTVCLHVEE